ncbi:ABC transporter ATP-binding protein [[Mycoplasma] testudinis]|uniref:ABC transporter ATP-binding protein n=1 Tax=[Mycoplasma] testudinis TaxID=33924 RepID=UPI00048508E2|nr:ABC transporter ATP-binding protein [[Mycoplasma] testudinis]
MNNSENLIHFENVSFSYKKKPLLHIDSLDIPENQIITILGPSGSGKTTLLNLIAGFLKPTSGKINIKGNAKTNNIGFILQESTLYENISVAKNVYLSAINSKGWVAKNKLEKIKQFFETVDILKTNVLYEKINQLLQKISSADFDNKLWNEYRHLFWKINFKLFKRQKLWFKFMFQTRIKKVFEQKLNEVSTKLQIHELLKQKASNLSGGQKQRVAFAKAIIKNSLFILMDEPFASLDVKIKDSTRDWLVDIQKELNLSIIFVTHDQNDALRISDKIMLLNQGKIVQFDTPENLYNNPINEFVAKFIGMPEIILISENENGKSYIRNNKIKIFTDQNSQDLILDKKLLGDLFVYEVFVNRLKRKIMIVNTSNQFNVTNKVTIEYNESDLLHFDSEGYRVFK